MTTAPFVERREVPDRRAEPTSMLAVLNPRGRRCRHRRSGEGEGAYVDRLSVRILLLTILILGLSTTDAALTLLHVAGGHGEANPLMNLALLNGTAAFLFTKGLLTVLGTVFLAVHQNFRVALAALHAIAVGYILLTCYHGAILAGLV